jgi:hypothetical protein
MIYLITIAGYGPRGSVKKVIVTTLPGFFLRAFSPSRHTERMGELDGQLTLSSYITCLAVLYEVI